LGIDNDTIVALATASGAGAIHIVRISGNKSLEIAKKITKKQNFTPRLATLSSVFDKDDLIDQAIVIYFKAPNSYTGEDIVEFQIHGNEVIASLIIKLAIKEGARIAKPGEFSKRAVINGKIDISEAVAISKLIEAKSIEGVKLLARQLKGELKVFVEKIRDDLVEILSYIEVSIDYAEEDLPKDLLDKINHKLNEIYNTLDKTVQKSSLREGLIDGFKVAIVGKPNVGKSSFLNRLLNYDRAIVSEIAGTTRDTIEESVKIGSHLIKIVDTAGIRNSSDLIEQIGIEKSKTAIKEADIIIAIFDNSKEFEQSDKEILDLIENSNKDIIYILNKIDLPKKFNKELKRAIKLSLKHNDLDKVIKELKDILDKKSSFKDTILVSLSQIELTKNALNSINEAKTNLKNNDFELFAFNINNAIDSISQISRPYDYNELLDNMFSNFCLGK